jgi:ABC-type Zn2+ transport system substrate-binding protein/surface adhesin
LNTTLQTLLNINNYQRQENERQENERNRREENKDEDEDEDDEDDEDEEENDENNSVSNVTNTLYDLIPMGSSTSSFELSENDRENIDTIVLITGSNVNTVTMYYMMYNKDIELTASNMLAMSD